MMDGERSLLLTVQHTEISDAKINRVPLRSIGFSDSSSQFVTISSRYVISVLFFFLLLSAVCSRSVTSKFISVWFSYFIILICAVCGDHLNGRKDLYVFDLNTQTYWYFDEAVKNCSCFTFEVGASSILVGTKYGSIFTVNLRKLCNFYFLYSD